MGLVQVRLSSACLRRGCFFLPLDRKSTRLNSSHGYISYAVFCLKKKKIELSLYLLLRSEWMNWNNATICSTNLILITLSTNAPTVTQDGLSIPHRHIRSSASCLL